MLGAFNWLDLLICVALLSFFIAGLRRGFLLTVGDMLGLIAGGVAAFFAIPMVSTFVSNPWGRVGLMVGVAAVLIILGQALGRVIATWIKRRLNFDVVRVFDRLMGGALSVLITATVIGALAFSTASMGIPRLSTEIANSKMIETIRGATPAFVTSAISTARSAVMAQTLPTILQPFAPTVEPVEAGDWAPTDAQLAAETSVAKISGTAAQCGLNLSGSGFVVGEELVMTNAHVVAGLSVATVELPEEDLRRARVVYFDPVADVALLHVEDLESPALPLATQDLERTDSAAFSGYPAGGPLQTRGAVVASQATVSIANIYGAEPGALSVYQLTAEVMQGNSGGPLLNDSGQTVGMVFAKSQSDDQIGFALSLNELRRALTAAEGELEPVSTGQCIG